MGPFPSSGCQRGAPAQVTGRAKGSLPYRAPWFRARRNIPNLSHKCSRTPSDAKRCGRGASSLRSARSAWRLAKVEGWSTGIRALAHCLCRCSCGAAPVVGVLDDDCVVGVRHRRLAGPADAAGALPCPASRVRRAGRRCAMVVSRRRSARADSHRSGCPPRSTARRAPGLDRPHRGRSRPVRAGRGDSRTPHVRRRPAPADQDLQPACWDLRSACAAGPSIRKLTRPHRRARAAVTSGARRAQYHARCTRDSRPAPRSNR
jgi:hypothetical protein